MHWFSCLNDQDPGLYDRYLTMYRVAVLTARETNPALRPVLVLDGAPCARIAALEGLGVRVIRRRVQCYDALRRHYGANPIAAGAFLRVDLPLVCEALGLADRYVLYTDVDVMFLGDLAPLHDLEPILCMCAGEFDPDADHAGCNTGVMWLNWRNLRKDHARFTAFITANLSRFAVYDQDAYKQHYRDAIERLDHRFNYKPYWGPGADIRILHFHGPKPTSTPAELERFPIPSLITPFFQRAVGAFRHVLERHGDPAAGGVATTA